MHRVPPPPTSLPPRYQPLVSLSPSPAPNTLTLASLASSFSLSSPVLRPRLGSSLARAASSRVGGPPGGRKAGRRAGCHWPSSRVANQDAKGARPGHAPSPRSPRRFETDHEERRTRHVRRKRVRIPSPRRPNFRRESSKLRRSSHPNISSLLDRFTLPPVHQQLLRARNKPKRSASIEILDPNGASQEILVTTPRSYFPRSSYTRKV